MTDANQYIKQLKMKEHPEGGYYANSFQSDEALDLGQLGRSGVQRPLWTSIYFLLKDGQVSHFHRLQSDELWYYHDGAPLHIHMINPNGTYQMERLGTNVDKGEKPQLLVKKGTIFGSTLTKGDFSLVGCMVSPGFDFADFELFTRKDLLTDYPAHEQIIKRLTFQ